MTDMPLHPAIVHLPIGLALVLPLLSLGVALSIRREWLPRRSWILVLLMHALLFGGALAAKQTGEQDEDRVEKVVGHDLIEVHEDRGKWLVILSGVTLLLTAAPVALGTRRGYWAAVAGAIAGHVAILVLALLVGEAGGAIVHGPDGLTSPALSGVTAEPDDDHD